MLEIFLKLSVSDRIQVIAIISTLIISVVSIAIAVATLIQTNKIAKESERAYIVFYIERLKHDDFHSIVIRNFGNSAGTLESIEINPHLEWNNRLKGFDATLLTDCKDIFLAPGQSIKSIFDFRNYPHKDFKVKVKYTTLGKHITEEYKINLIYRESLMNFRDDNIEGNSNILKGIYETLDNQTDRLL